MTKSKVAEKESSRLFKSNLLESLTRTHIAVPVLIFILYSLGLLYWSLIILQIDVVFIILLYLTGLVTFTWVEYQVHRHLFHIFPSSEKRKNIQYKIHGVHHDFPKDKKRLAMPPVLSVAIATLLLILLKLILGSFSMAFLAGFLCGYAGYILVHYIIHVFQPPQNFFRKLWIHHSMHHYKNSERAFGVSSPLWDYLYKTMP